MKTEVVYVTPKMAHDWLKANTANRPLRRITVDSLKAAYNRGEWRLTHQGIAFSKDGVLKDGQHRLVMISELPPSSKVPVMVTRDLDDDVFGVIDVGVRRTASDELGVDSTHAAVSAFVAAIFNGNQRTGMTAQYLVPFVLWCEPYLTQITAFCGTKRAPWTSAPVLSAAVVQIARGNNADFVKAIYRGLVLRDVRTLTPVALALMNQVQDGKAGGARSFDLFCRALRVFDSKASATVRRVQINDVTATTAEVRTFLESVIHAAKLERGEKKARTRRAKD